MTLFALRAPDIPDVLQVLRGMSFGALVGTCQLPAMQQRFASHWIRISKDVFFSELSWFRLTGLRGAVKSRVWPSWNQR